MATWQCAFCFLAWVVTETGTAEGFINVFSSPHHIILSAYHHCIIILHHQDTVAIQTHDKKHQKNKISHATFSRIQPIVPGFVLIIIRFARIPGRSAEFTKKWHVKFQLSNGSKIARMAPISIFLGRNRSWRSKLFFSEKLRATVDRIHFRVDDKFSRRANKRKNERKKSFVRGYP